jgi:hypothetical protein
MMMFVMFTHGVCIYLKHVHAGQTIPYLETDSRETRDSTFLSHIDSLPNPSACAHDVHMPRRDYGTCAQPRHPHERTAALCESDRLEILGAKLSQLCVRSGEVLHKQGIVLRVHLHKRAEVLVLDQREV